MFDIINNPSHTYETLKKVLIQLCSDDTEVKFRKLFGVLEIGEHKPSQFLRDIQNLAGSTTSMEIQLNLFGCNDCQFLLGHYFMWVMNH